MKLWYGYGSEHSSNLVMIGRFKESDTAHEVKEILDKLAQQEAKDNPATSSLSADHVDAFSEDMLKLLQDSRLYGVGPAELEQLNYDVRITVSGKDVVIRTEQNEVSVFLKIMLERGARIEVYSAHDYPDKDKQKGN